MSEVPGSGVSERWIEWRRTVDLIKYDQRWDAMAARGDSIHGEADFVERLIGDRKVRLLDAGCGTGRLAIEMVKRGHHAIGADLDPDMIGRAATKAPHIDWHVADLSELRLDSKFDVIVMAGNIPLVGFHDFMSVLLSGNNVLCKLSSSDDRLWPLIIQLLIEINPEYQKKIKVVSKQIL